MLLDTKYKKRCTLKHQKLKCEWGQVRVESLCMVSNLSHYHLQIRCYTFKIFYLSLMVTMREVAIVITHRFWARRHSIRILKDVRTEKMQKDKRQGQKAHKTLIKWQYFGLIYQQYFIQNVIHS